MSTCVPADLVTWMYAYFITEFHTYFVTVLLYYLIICLLVYINTVNICTHITRVQYSRAGRLSSCASILDYS